MLAVLREGPAAGVYSICLDEDRSLLPEESGAVVAWDDDAGAATVEQHGMAAVAAARSTARPRRCASRPPGPSPRSTGSAVTLAAAACRRRPG